LLAAEHRDDISPISRYYKTNVVGVENILRVMREKNINHIIFTSTVAVYGIDVDNPKESSNCNPFNHYGKSKLEAENILKKWYKEDPANRILDIIRPTVVFGEGNLGNVYNLINQIATKRFAMIGNGKNKKSMAYVGNLVVFIKHLLNNTKPGLEIYNYTDSPDLSTIELVSLIKKELKLPNTNFFIPKWLGFVAGYFFDLTNKLTRKNFPISSVRIKKFCANTTFNTDKLKRTSFSPKYKLTDGLKRTIRHEYFD